MAYFPDLSPYEYLAGDPECHAELVNVGWLDQAYAYEKGPVAGEMSERVKQICLFEATRQTRGFHRCQFCSLPVLSSTPKQIFGTAIVAGQRRLGSAEIRVKGAGRTVYAVPDLIYHYITEHSYRPPAEFLDAVARSMT